MIWWMQSAGSRERWLEPSEGQLAIRGIGKSFRIIFHLSIVIFQSSSLDERAVLRDVVKILQSPVFSWMMSTNKAGLTI
jgi:hypothetical protein